MGFLEDISILKYVQGEDCALAEMAEEKHTRGEEQEAKTGCRKE